MSPWGYLGPGDRLGTACRKWECKTSPQLRLSTWRSSASLRGLQAARTSGRTAPGPLPRLVQKFSARPSASVTGKAWKPSKKGNGQEGLSRETTAPWRRTDGSREADRGGTWGSTSVPRIGGGHMPGPASVSDAGTAHTLLTFPSGHGDLTAIQGTRAYVLGACPLLCRWGKESSRCRGPVHSRRTAKGRGSSGLISPGFPLSSFRLLVSV